MVWKWIPFSLQFNYQPVNGKGIRDSYQTIDTWSNKARHNSIRRSNVYFWLGWRRSLVKSQG